jgi:hypothetical protein
MGERSERPVVRLRLVLDFGEAVELDGSTVYDPVAEATVPAVVLRMPPHRAAWFGRVLSAYTRMCRLAGLELDAAERGPAWALERAASAVGFADTVASAVGPQQVTSARKMAAAGVLRDVEDFDDITTIAVVEAAARWLEEPDGDEYAYALLGAVTDQPAQSRAFAWLVGGGNA